MSSISARPPAFTLVLVLAASTLSLTATEVDATLSRQMPAGHIAPARLPSANPGAGGAYAESTPALAPGLPIRAVAVGNHHSCAITWTGGVKCWGDNLAGQLGDGTTSTRRTPVDVVGLTSGVVAISAGQAATCALMTTGRVKCWGINDAGQLGDGTTTTRRTPVDVVGLPGPASSISVGFRHACAVSAGQAWCWGRGEPARPAPARVSGLGNGVRQIVAGNNHDCAVTTAGGIRCWGENTNGQLGDGTTTHRPAPVDVVGLTSGVRAVAVGGSATCATTTTGAVTCWGVDYGTVPVPVVGLGAGVLEIALGGSHTCALTVSGHVLCWGMNWYGQLGDGSLTASDTPAQVVGLTSGVGSLAAATTGYHTCASTRGGGVKCWGHNGDGRLGNGKTTASAVPVAVDFTVHPTIALAATVPSGTIARGTTVSFVAAVRPLAPGGVRSIVRFVVYRLDAAGIWRTTASRDVRADATGRATLPWTFELSGSRYVRAKVIADPTYSASPWSRSITYTVG